MELLRLAPPVIPVNGVLQGIFDALGIYMRRRYMSMLGKELLAVVQAVCHAICISGATLNLYPFNNTLVSPMFAANPSPLVPGAAVCPQPLQDF